MTSQDTAPTTTGTGESATDSPVIRRDDPLGSIRAMAESHNNWGRWGQDDVLGTLNFIDDGQAHRGRSPGPTGEAFSLSQPFDTNGPQKGWRRRTNPVHTMPDTGVDAERGNQGFPHGIGGADDVIAMPLQCSTQWDGLGHIFDHGKAWNGRRAGDVVTSEGDLVTGIETAAAGSSPAASCWTSAARSDPSWDGTTASCPTASPSPPSTSSRPSTRRAPARRSAAATSCSSAPASSPGSRRDGWGDYAGGPAPGLSFTHRRLAAPHRDRRDRHRHLGFRGAAQRVRRRLPAAAPGRHPQHRAVPRRDVGPRRPRGRLRRRRQVRLPAHRGAPAHHRRRRLARQPDRPPVIASSVQQHHNHHQSRRQYKGVSDGSSTERRNRRGGSRGTAAAILLADAGIQVDILEKADAPQTLGSGITLQGNALRVLRQLGVWEQVEAKGYAFSTLGLRAPDPAGTVIAVLDDMRTGGDDLPATMGMYRPDLAAILRERAGQAGARISYGKTVTELHRTTAVVTVSTADGGTARYDLLIGADGLHSLSARPSASMVNPGPRAWASGARSWHGRRTWSAPT